MNEKIEYKKHPSKLKDHELVNRFNQTGKISCYNELYEKYKTKTYSKCMSFFKNEVDAEDANQDIWIKIFEKLHTFNGNSAFSTWIYSITRNYCIDVIRKKKKDQIVISQDDGTYEVLDDSETYDYVHNYRLKLLNSLRKDDKKVLELKYLSGYSIKEISKMINKSESAVKMQIKRAKIKYMELYNKQIAAILVS
jgi:RNA polymerase sigma factor (sigma-70 family)